MKVSTVANINILESDAFSDIMCAVCERSVEHFYKFRCLVQEAQYNLKNKSQVKRVISPPRNPMAGKQTQKGKSAFYFMVFY